MHAEKHNALMWKNEMWSCGNHNALIQKDVMYLCVKNIMHACRKIQCTYVEKHNALVQKTAEYHEVTI